MHLKVSKKFMFWYVVLYSNNGEKLMHSEMYANKSNAVRAAKRLQDVLGVELSKVGLTVGDMSDATKGVGDE